MKFINVLSIDNKFVAIPAALLSTVPWRFFDGDGWQAECSALTLLLVPGSFVSGRV